ncbi:uncharacterized protein C8R40DRAFT_1263648 [Lentinula edodes]|uniref:uncharacterized protein n=1 Tax=Lentinula edodes TaxID=5353 RepID=UPI001E8D0B71|nr:uncharacterized protein C8R40DRAFT_1263648 [Lentinula edodes]KAH7877818.1 hypothetical protein C8R40DRAFT_1263648 [Lentinula edodes]
MAAHIPSISNEPKERNRQLLEIMAKKLSKMSSFEQYANRLANWASDPRAYYDDVKETIIKLLERALLTMQNELRLDPRLPFNIHLYLDKPFIVAYRTLIQTVYRFRDKFPRDGLRLHSRLQALYMTTTPPDEIIDVEATNSPDSSSVAQFSGTVSSSSIISTPVDPIVSPSYYAHPPQLPPLLVPSPSAPSISLKDSISPSLHYNIVPSMASFMHTANSDPINSSISVTAADPEPLLASTTPQPPAKPPASSLPERLQSDESISAVAKPRKKKRKKLNLSEMLDLDQADQVESPTGPISIVSSEGHDLKVEAMALDPAVKSSEPDFPTPDMQGSSTVGIKRARSNSSSRMPGSHSPNFLDRVLKWESPIDRTEHEHRPLSIEPHESAAAHITSALVEDKDKDSPDAEDAMEVDIEPAQDNGPEDEIMMDVINNNLQTVEASLTTSDKLESVKAVEVLPPTPDEANDASSTTMALNDAPQPIIIKTPHKVSLPEFSGFSKTLNTRKQEGLSTTAQIAMRFTVDREQLTSLENWNRRNISPIREDRKETLCISLACYLRADMAKNPGNYNALKSRWPKRHRLDLNVTKQDGTNKTIPLNPPTVCTPDGFVDLGPFIKQGENIIKISQNGDLSAYVFCLHVHDPTLAQIQRLNQVLDANMEWEIWCKSVSRPLNLEPSTFALHAF